MRTTDDGYLQPGVGLISVGWMGKLHSRAYQAIPLVYPELKIQPRFVHAADTAAGRAGYARDVLGYARASTDYRDVLADPDVDVVSICAPNMLHREIGVAAARAGKPFWIEKPVGRDASETAEVAAAARAAGVTTSIGYNYRHVPAVERVRELVAAGQLGRITNVRAVFFNSYAAEPNGALSWRFRREEAGSGALGDLLSHVVDLMQYVVAPITEVSSLLSTVYAQRPILPMGSATHFAVIEDGELGEVENDDYDPAELTRLAPDRIAHTHFKDVNDQIAAQVRSGRLTYTEAVRRGIYRPLGSGDIDVAAIVGHLRSRDYGGWYVLEQDTILTGEPRGEGPVTDVRQSADYLRKLLTASR